MKDTVGWKWGIWLSPTLIQAWCHWRLCHLGLKGDRKKRWAAQTLSKRFNNQEQEKKKERRATQLDREFPTRILRWVGLPASFKKQGGPEWCWEVTPISVRSCENLPDPDGSLISPQTLMGSGFLFSANCGERFASSATAEGDRLCFSSVGFRVSTSLLSLFVRAGRLSSELWSLKVSTCYLLTAGGSQFRARKCTE